MIMPISRLARRRGWRESHYPEGFAVLNHPVIHIANAFPCFARRVMLCVEGGEIVANPEGFAKAWKYRNKKKHRIMTMW